MKFTVANNRSQILIKEIKVLSALEFEFLPSESPSLSTRRLTGHFLAV
jgi:hypothetical protein